MNTEYVIAAIECLIDAKVNGTEKGVRQAQKELRKAFGTSSWNEAHLAPCAAKLKVDFEEDLPKTRYVTFLYDKGGDSALARLASPTRRMIQVDKDEYGVISGIDVDKDEYRRFSKHKIIGNIEEIV